jgi:GDP-L-fucose synthase
MMKVFLTGSNGLVGTNIKENKPKHVDLLTPEIDFLNLLDEKAVDRYLKKERPDVIIHAAGIVGGIQANIAQPVKFLSLNTMMANNLILSARKHKVKYILNLGSSCMYPRDASNPLNENMILKGELEPTNEGYALAKIYAHRLCSYINLEDNSINYKTLIPCNLYGKYDKFDPEWSHMIPAVIRKIYNAKENASEAVEIWGDGEARREFMYAGDLANFVWYAVDNIDTIPEVLNVGLGYDYSINDFYQTIAEVIGYKGEFIHDITKPIGMKQKLVDITRLKALNWEPAYSLKDGIERTFEYFIENN